MGIIHSNDISAETTIQQSNTWESEVRILKDQMRSFGEGRIIFEYTISRMIFRPPTSPGFMDSGNIQNTQRLSPQAFRRPRDRRVTGMDYRQRKRQREQGGTSFLYPRTADLHGSLRETGHHSDTCNNRPYCAYTGSFHAHTGSQCFFFGSYYRSSVKDSSQKPCEKHK